MALSQPELERLADTDVGATIPPAEAAAAFATPPFVAAPPLFNLRDIGRVPGSAVRPRLAYRCGMLPSGAESQPWLASSVKRIFDLRLPDEIKRAPEPTVPGVEAVQIHIKRTFSVPGIDVFAVGDGSEAWAGVYLELLDVYGPAICAVLEHVRDRPGEPFLFHCTAGRDRTGVLAGLLHELAGTPPAAIVLDYRLTRIGIEPQREMLTQVARRVLHVPDDDTAISPGMHNFSTLSPHTWPVLTDMVQTRYGSWEGYVRQLGLSDTDIGSIRKNLCA